MNPPDHIPDRHEPARIQAMFNAIAPRYDLLNHLLSFGLDVYWRKKAIRYFTQEGGGVYLDIAAGSGDSSIALLSLRPRQIVATDFAFGMLKAFERKLLTIQQRERVDLLLCDAHDLPFPDRHFDGTVVAFGIRNFRDRLRALREMHRVLRPGGVSIILELTTPSAPGIAQIYTAYSRLILPHLGRLISGSDFAYEYLPSSIRAFPERREFLAAMRQAGFSTTTAVPLTFGTVTLFLGKK
jgi:demethylmenaquinone methyltransferase/2-methoxy-6-polyprenyl-1,4-benzoquinol methylase